MEENKPYKPIYKCRLCGEIYTELRRKRIKKLENVLKKTPDVAIKFLEKNNLQQAIHYCKDYSIGIADFQGLKKEGD